MLLEDTSYFPHVSSSVRQNYVYLVPCVLHLRRRNQQIESSSHECDHLSRPPVIQCQYGADVGPLKYYEKDFVDGEVENWRGSWKMGPGSRGRGVGRRRLKVVQVYQWLIRNKFVPASRPSQVINILMGATTASITARFNCILHREHW